MKKTILAILQILITGLYILNGQNSSVRYSIINQCLNDMLYDSLNRKILITIPSSDIIHGNSIGFINPDSSLLSNFYYIGSEPSTMAITSSCHHVYIGMDGSATVKKIDLVNNYCAQTFSLGVNTFWGPKYAYCISCQPENDSIIAVSRIFSDQNNAGVAIFRNGIMLSDTIDDPFRSRIVRFFSPSLLYGYDNASSAFNFSKISVSNSGATIINQFSNLIQGFDISFYISGIIAFSDFGAVLDISTGQPSLIGTCNIDRQNMFGNPKACIDQYSNRLCFAGKGRWGDTLYIERFNTSTLLRHDIIKIPGAFGDVKKIICWGDSNRLAVSTTSGQLLIINGLLPGIPDPITGPSIVCSGQNNVHYSVPSVLRANSYTWFVPPGAQIQSGQGTNNIIVNFGNNSGTVSVVANNNIGSGGLTYLPVNIINAPNTPGQIVGISYICIGREIQSYNISNVYGATYYVWSVPNDAMILSGQGTNSIQVSFADSSGNISVKAGNDCGISNESILSAHITHQEIPDIPGPITGLTSVIQGQSGVLYSIEPVSGATSYVWSFEGPAVIISGQGTDSIRAKFIQTDNTSLTLNVQSSNVCGLSAPSKLNISAINDIEENKSSNSVIIYPNPTIDLATIEFINHVFNGNIAIYDIYGKQLYLQYFSNNRIEIDLRKFIKGIYYIKLFNDKYSCVHKILKQ